MKKSLIPLALAALMTLAASCTTTSSATDYFLSNCGKAFPEGTDIQQLDRQFQANRSEWEAAVAFLSRPDLDTLSLGRYQLTEQTYANIQEYTPSPAQGRYEAHRKYIDIQYAISGEEYVYVAGLEDAREVSMPYSEGKDCEFYNLAVRSSRLAICPDHFVVLFPSEAHMPGRPTTDSPAPIRKVVVKVPAI